MRFLPTPIVSMHHPPGKCTVRLVDLHKLSAVSRLTNVYLLYHIRDVGGTYIITEFLLRFGNVAEVIGIYLEIPISPLLCQFIILTSLCTVLVAQLISRAKILPHQGARKTSSGRICNRLL